MKLNRRQFARTATGAYGAGAAPLTVCGSALTAQEQDFFLRLLRANAETVSRLLQQPRVAPSPRVGRGGNLAALVTAYCAPESPYHRDPSLIPQMESAARVFVEAQHPDGTLDAANNLASPPDTAFVVEGLAACLGVLRRVDEEALAPTRQLLEQFLRRAGEALVTGGVHTPNHRWVVCAALARINALFPSARYVARIDDWLDEGIYIDADGQFAERSPNYARVTVNALITMARLLRRPELLEPARRNLDATLYLLHPDGELETVASRRQDQTRPLRMANFYLLYRYMAILDRNPTYAAVVRLIESQPGEGLIEGQNPAIYFLEEPLLRQPLPPGGSIPSDYARIFAGSGLARIRRGNLSASIYGGSDWPLGVASGLASNPTFFTFRNGRAALLSVRMGGQFFSLGAFRSQGLKVAGGEYLLEQRLEVPYYQPLPKHLRNPRGDYPPTPARDGRFWSKMDFPHRPVSNIVILDQKVRVVERRGGFDLHISVTGPERVPYTVELAFAAGGEFEGPLRELLLPDGARVLLLKTGHGRYRVGADCIEFGPGRYEHERLDLSGHTYIAHGARLRPSGIPVYITGFTPFEHVLTIRAVGSPQ